MKSTKKEKKQYKKAFQEAMARELREHKSSFIVFSILRILVLVVLVRQIMLANYEGAFFCVLTLAAALRAQLGPGEAADRAAAAPGDHHFLLHLRGGDSG